MNLIANVSLSAASSVLKLDLSPKTYSDTCEMFPLTILSSFGDSSDLAKPPSEPVPRLSMISRRVSKAVGSFTTKKAEESLTQGWSEVASSITIGSPSKQIRDGWVQQIQTYSAWFSREYLTDRSDGKQPQVIIRGWCWKKGQMSFSAWKLRHFVLYSNRELVYSESEYGTEPLGTIDLKKKQVRFGKCSDKPQGFEEIIEIETPNRVWYISPRAQTRSEHSQVLNHWYQAIAGSDEHFERHHSMERSTFQYSPTSFFIPPNAVELAPGSGIPIVRLSGWEKISGNVPQTLISPSPSKAELLLRGVVVGGASRRRSILSNNTKTNTEEQLQNT